MADLFETIQRLIGKILKSTAVTKQLDYEKVAECIIQHFREAPEFSQDVGEWLDGFCDGGSLDQLFTRKVKSLVVKQWLADGTELLFHNNIVAYRLFKIPSYKRCTLKSIALLAMYIGFFTYDLRVSEFPPGFVRTFKDQSMNKLFAYVKNTEQYVTICQREDVQEKIRQISDDIQAIAASSSRDSAVVSA